MNRRDRRAAAAQESRSSSSRSGVLTPDALYQAGIRHLRAGRHLDAQVCCQQALATDSGHADSLHLMGLLSIEARQYDHAMEWIVRALQQASKPEYLSSLGTALKQQGRLVEALEAFDKAVQLKPDDAELWKKLGGVLVALGRPADALSGFQQALKLNSRQWDAASNCGIILHKLGRFAEAHPYFELCHALQPNHARTLFMRGRCLIDLGRFEEALADNQRAHALDPTNPAICNNLGSILRSLSRDEEALPWFDRALALQPDSMEALNNRGVCLGQLHRFDEAFATYRRAKALDPDNAGIVWNEALLQMLTGNFEAGWAGREARWKRAVELPYPAFNQPKWLGKEPIEGKTILVRSDEGLGDSIQFARYIPLLAARGARVILNVLDPLSDLLSGVRGVTQCLPISASAQLAFDMHCPMASLPLAFGTRLDTIPAGTSYLPEPAQRRVQSWQARLDQSLRDHAGRSDRLRIGLVWSGNPNHKNDHNRSLSLRTLSRILDVDATFVSLQKDPRAADKAALLERSDIIDLTAHLTDLSQTAALVKCLDLVITIDSSVAHLAAALGCPTWILLPYAPDYRWLLDRDDSPWYPSARLFRQTETRDYGEVLDRVRGELMTLIAAHRVEARR